MNEKLIYNIAGHTLLIETTNAKTTSRLIPSFKPFETVNAANAHDATNTNSFKESDLLFKFSGNSEIEIPNRAPDDAMEIDGAFFDVYHIKGGVTVSMKLNDRNSGNRVHAFTICVNKKIVTSNLTLLQPYENRFLAYFLRTAFGISSAHHKTIKLHASVIEKGGRALVFLGKSGTGKSTHSQLWQEFVPGCQLLNDDEPIVRVMKDGSVRVYGTPWSGSTPCYRNAWAEIAAFARLYQSSENRLIKLKGVHAFAALLESVALLRSDSENRQLVIATLNDILEQSKVYRLDNRPNREAVALSQTLMA